MKTVIALITLALAATFAHGGSLQKHMRQGAALQQSAAVKLENKVKGEWTGELLGSLTEHHDGSPVTALVALGADFIASGSDDGLVHIWNLKTGELIRTIDELRGADVTALAALGEDFIATGSGEGTVRIANWRTGERGKTIKGSGEKNLGVSSLAALGPDSNEYREACGGCIVAIGHQDSTIRISNWRTGELIRRIEGVGLPGDSDLGALAALGADYLASGGYKGTVFLFNWRTGTTDGKLRDIEHGAGHRRIGGGNDEHILLSSTGTGAKTWNGSGGNKDDVTALAALGADCMATGYSDGTIHISDWETGEVLHKLTSHTDSVTSNWAARIFALVDLGGDKFASASGDETIRIFNWKTGVHLHTLTGHDDEINALVCLRGANGSLVGMASGSIDGTIRLWHP